LPGFIEAKEKRPTTLSFCGVIPLPARKSTSGAHKYTCDFFLVKSQSSLLLIKSNNNFQIDITAIIGSFFPELEALIAWLYRGGRKETNDVIISWCNDILQTRRGMQLPEG
jgi:hypothetical protein